MLAAQATFYYMAAASVASALLAVTRRNPVHSMLWVLVLFLHVAGIFLLLYAGAILIFYLFVLMLLDLPGEESRPRFGMHWPFAAVVGVSFAWLAWLAGAETFDRDAAGAATVTRVAADAPVKGGLEEVGMALFGPYALPFEVAGLVLLAAIVGAVVLARKRETSS